MKDGCEMQKVSPVFSYSFCTSLAFNLIVIEEVNLAGLITKLKEAHL